MENTASDLAKVLVAKLAKTDSSERLLVGVAGIPASGKTTFARLLVEGTNSLLTSSGTDTRALLIGLDGWHLSRVQLDAFPDPKLAHDRRGIHWTFDAEGYVKFIRSLRGATDVKVVITAPSFDHALKDPTYDDISVHAHHRIVVIEGLYPFLSVEPWVEASRLLDERWFVDVDIDVAKDRLVKRHVLTGVAKDLEEAEWRARENDMPNGLFIIANILEPTLRIPSIQDPGLITS